MADEASREPAHPGDDAGLELPAPLSRGDLPTTLWTLFYSYGSVFSTGPIGREIVWLFGDRDRAEAALSEALEAEPDAGELTVGEVAVDEVAERYPFAVFIDEINAWPVLLAAGPEQSETPLPDEPFALFVWGGGIDRSRDEHRDGEWVIHRDERGDYVLFFEDLDAAEQVLREFRDATGDDAEVRRTRALSLAMDQSVRFYHTDGSWEDLSRDEYLRRCR